MNKDFFTSVIVSFILIFIFYENSFSQVNQEWVARYNGPGDTTDFGHIVSVDDSGNVYAAGISEILGLSNNYTTIKYNSSGVQQWVASYDNGNDILTSMTLDKSGNVYVTGNSSGSGTDYDYATVKYNSSGLQQWVARYNGPGNLTDVANVIAVDDSGNVYVTGYSFGTGSGYDYATIKYNSSGVQQWVARYNGPGNNIDKAYCLAIDAFGNIIVSGSSFASATGDDIATVKYNSFGEQLWTARYNKPGGRDDDASSIALDSSGNIYITGNSSDSNYSNSDFTTIKYNSSGEMLWVAGYNGTANVSDYANSIAVDKSGNVYVAGNSYNTGTIEDITTVKYNSAGTRQWVAKYNGTANSADYERAIILDRIGNVYVTGSSSETGTSFDYITIKYNPDGTQQWLTKYNGPANSLDLAGSIDIDTVGYVYVTGLSSSSSTNFDFATIKYSQTTGIVQLYSEIPEGYKLSQNYPNPFNPKTIINYELQITNLVKLVVYDVLGNEAALLVNEKQSPGTYQVEFDGSNLPSGVYFYKLTAGEFSDTKKMMLLK